MGMVRDFAGTLRLKLVACTAVRLLLVGVVAAAAFNGQRIVPPALLAGFGVFFAGFEDAAVAVMTMPASARRERVT